MTRKVYALIDCNNFFVSCERVFRPDLWARPVVVLSNNDGCIVSRSDEVKALGVPMGEPYFKVRDVLTLNKAQVFSANFSLYGDLSQRITDVLAQFCPKLEVYSIDESFADISDFADKDYEAWARNLRHMIYKWVGIPVAIGIAPTKTLAKAAAEYAKKHPAQEGVCSVVDASVQKKVLDWLPIEEVWGIGWRRAPKLRDQGISTAAALIQVDDKWALKHLTINGLKTIKELRGEPCIGLDVGKPQRKTIGRSRSFGHIVRAAHQIESAVATFAAQAAVTLRAQESVAGGIVVYLRARTPEGSSKGLVTLKQFNEPTADTGTIIQASAEGVSELYDVDLGYKKAGIVLVGIAPRTAWQLSLVTPEIKRDKKVQLMSAIDMLNNRYGSGTVWHATEARHQAQWHSKHERRSPAYTTNWQDLPKVSISIYK